MSWDSLFSLTNAVAMLGWLALAILPRKPLTLSAVLYLGVGLLCLAYASLFVLSVGQWIDPVRVAGTAAPDLLDYSIAGLRPLFMSDGGIVIGWTIISTSTCSSACGSRATPTPRGSGG